MKTSQIKGLRGVNAHTAANNLARLLLRRAARFCTGSAVDPVRTPSTRAAGTTTEPAALIHRSLLALRLGGLHTLGNLAPLAFGFGGAFSRRRSCRCRNQFDGGALVPLQSTTPHTPRWTAVTHRPRPSGGAFSHRDSVTKRQGHADDPIAPAARVNSGGIVAVRPACRTLRRLSSVEARQ
jgi:hypothetical protein